MVNARIRKIDKTAVEIESERMSDYIKYINEKNIKEVQINAQYYFEKDLSFLIECPAVTSVYIVNPIIEDYSHLYSMKNLRILSTEAPLGKLDISLLTNLVELNITWSKQIKNIHKCRTLKELKITKYNVQSKNFEGLSLLTGLVSVGLIQPNITSLSGIQNMKNLQSLEVSYARALEKFEGIEELFPSFKELELTNCPNLKEYERLGGVKSMEKLIIDRCADIPSLEFISRLPHLKYLVFLDTEVKDGDLSPCKGINYVSFTNKKNFSHQTKDFL